MDNQFRYTDEELIARFQEGDEQAYVELVNRYRDKLMSFVYRFVNDMEQAEDIVQDALLKLFTHKHYYKNIAKFSTWIYTIAGNLAKTELRKKKTRKVTNLSQMGPEDRDYELPSVAPETDNVIQNEYIEKKIQAAIQKLPIHFRTVTILRDIQELSYEEISKIVDVPLGTVKSRINRARLQLQKDLKDLK
ncbi:MAG: sigma-70 family RNA polymerase sigma factor [Candidatus Marinimicrobia bacterium]|jgi:RNA polymerase sigma-70 factor (ECF subfamily)|nr:sigma-70 family RNA polymerase sigma factor [Candidatus Neomarinimicrobiota bacterium]MBT3676535.1 sigma-70 family RNA polymerase sigma factor [Candidatus Neomarinimicrobiota bacterium]MBT3762524.1 sigma-70 family RNA polymerase sigma factor [Candidatus Neomarinimicrobiota bacterium]MBT4069347.1 sigma-70 family RNA polymerase sigma factor [Candidatus Neomarinimicrobiota bacterium]MBT4269841.1 sigma-70 family RNA polymerase sigma factor [Candidatus Neomarinimicrobiota bacterium]